MKNIILQFPSFRGRRPLAVALLLGCLGAATLSAQSPSGASSTGSSAGSTTDRSGSTAGQSGVSGSRQGAGASSGVSTNSDTRNANDLTRASDTSSLKRADRKFLTKVAESSHQEVVISQLAAQRATRPDVRSFAQELVSGHQRMNSDLIQLAQRKGVKLESLGLSMSSSGTSMMDASRNAGIATDHGAPRATGAAGTANTGASIGVMPNASTATSGSPTSGSDANSMASMSADLSSDRQYRRLARATGDDFDHEYVDMMVDHHERDVKTFQKAAQNAQDPEVRAFANNHLPELQAHLDQANSLMKAAAE